MKKIDLHIHTKASFDGELPSEQIIKLAIERGLKIIAVTDHNSIGGIQEGLEYTKEKKIMIIPGIEISCDGKEFGTPYVDIIGLFIDNKSVKLNNFLKYLKKTKKLPSIEHAIEIIRDTKGIAILAHPGLYLGNINNLIDFFILKGGLAIEVDYPYYELYDLNSRLLIKKFKRIAKEKNLLVSGGSDFHGNNRNAKLGSHGIGKKEFEKLKKQFKNS